MHTLYTAFAAKSSSVKGVTWLKDGKLCLIQSITDEMSSIITELELTGLTPLAYWGGGPVVWSLAASSGGGGRNTGQATHGARRAARLAPPSTPRQGAAGFTRAKQIWGRRSHRQKTTPVAPFFT